MTEKPEVGQVCDCHIHSFEKNRPAQAGTYASPEKDLADYVIEASQSNIARAVIVQASIDGTDNSGLVRTLKSSSVLEVRGVAMVDPESAQLEDLNAAGVRALRVLDRARFGWNDLGLLSKLSRLAASMSWHIELNTEPDSFDSVVDQIRDLPQGQLIVLDHIGHIDPQQPEHLTALRKLLDSGRVWVKLTPTRVSRYLHVYRDLTDIVSLLASTYPDRCIWGSDWPHVMTEPPLPKISTMLDFFADVLTDEQFRACMWTNPSNLYGF
jgi:predicted TIM-barrel fold metal-dependent hydrolase